MTGIPTVRRSRDGGNGAETPPADETGEHRFPCPACGSDLRFSASTGELVCDHCGHVEKIAATGRAQWNTALRELDYQSALQNDMPRDEMGTARTVHCNSCGANFELGENEQATECPFCSSPVVIDTGPQRHLKPQALLPFALDEKTARQRMTDWLGRLWFAPGGLREYARKGRRMRGIYVPFWTYDARTRSRYSGQRGDDYFETHTQVVNGRREQVQVRKTRWRPVSGAVARNFDDVLVLASDTLPREDTDALTPWDLGELVPYQPHYLSGYVAEAYSVGLEPGFAIARRKMDAVIASDVRRDIGGDHQRITRLDTEVSGVTFKHILLPVWLAAYKFRGRTYRFVVNARTGEVKGERPYSAWKIAFAVLLALIVAGGLFYLNAMQGQYPGGY